MSAIPFLDRAQAGRRLAAGVKKLRPALPVVYALPRGGVPVAIEVAEALDAPLDLLLVRKIGVSGQEELAAAAIVDGEALDVILNEEIMRAVGLTQVDIDAAAKRQLQEIERRRALYLPGRAPVPAEGRTAILVDDGVATGASMRAAIAAVRRRRPRRIMVAVPVAAEETVRDLRGAVDDIVCLAAPARLGAVGNFYRDFHQIDDREVIALLRDFVR